ncbi:hypothetical protein E0M25_21575 [Bacillus mycoides]|nr:hypothetical protein E0M25_21575 [Bacillus mycoides]
MTEDNNKLGSYHASKDGLITVTLNSVSPHGEVQQAYELIYTLEIANNGIASTGTMVKDALPKDVTYVLGTTVLNGQKVDDIGGKSPIETGMLVNSPRTNFGVVFVVEESKVVVTFKVKVNESVQPGTKIINTATVLAREVP